VRALPYVRRRVYWAPINELRTESTDSCASCVCSIGMIVVNNNDSQQQTCSWTSGITVAQASQWQETFSLQSVPQPIDALKGFLNQLSASVQHQETTTITLNQQSTTTQSYTCAMIPNFQLGFYDQCELWQIHEIYDIVGPDQQPWSDPVYQVVLPPVIDNPLVPAWNSSYFDCTKGSNACVPVPHS
jgi:hypothetical protein